MTSFVPAEQCRDVIGRDGRTDGQNSYISISLPVCIAWLCGCVIKYIPHSRSHEHRLWSSVC